ncbi:hypothetical protein RCL1_005613 [Eukaryota sp. TZLM3-RCL]
MLQLLPGLEAIGGLIIILIGGFCIGFFKILNEQAMRPLVFVVHKIALPSALFVFIAPYGLDDRAIPTILTALCATVVVLLLLAPFLFTNKYNLGGIASAFMATTGGNVCPCSNLYLRSLLSEHQ